MGREIRKVPAGWKHPKEMMPYGYDYRPMHNQNYDDAVKEYKAEAALWAEGKHEDQDPDYKEYSEYAGELPKRKWYRPYKDEDCTHFQMYETVSEGTPVTPVFATLLEMEDYLVNTGECAGTKYNRKYSRESAHAFCNDGWAPTFVGIPGKGLVDGVTASSM